MIWPDQRAEDIVTRLRACFDGSRVGYRFHSSPQVAHHWGRHGYLPAPDQLKDELLRHSPEPFTPTEYANIHLVMCGGGSEEIAALWALRRQLGEAAVIGIWLWDNHWGHLQNLACALAADFVFVSHDYASGYLFQPASVVARHIPACSAQWTRQQAMEAFAAFGHGERRHKLLVNYVKYAGASPDRQRLLEEYAQGLDCADVFLMPSNDRSRYADLDPMQRFAEWANYKSTVIVPVDQDVSTRIFDALLAGLIPIVPDHIADFDAVIAPDIQRNLGIVRTTSLELPALRIAAVEALTVFDAQGQAGALARHRYALEHHMLVNRLTGMLHCLWQVGNGELKVRFDAVQERPGLYLERTS